MEVPHDREHLEHLLCSSRGPPPVLSAEGDLGNLLPRAEAVVDGATPKALLPEAWVNAAAQVRFQMGTSLTGAFRDREVCRGWGRRRATAQCDPGSLLPSSHYATSCRAALCFSP